jgi:PhnB protein
MSLQPTPETAMPQLNAYLSFNGNCAEAVQFYAQALGAEVETLLRVRDTPMAPDSPPEVQDQVMHAYLVHPGGFSLMAGDSMGMPYSGVHGVSMTLNYDTVAEARAAFEALSVGGTVTMPLAEAFWADIFGMLTDRFGVPWIVNGGTKPLPAQA